jgi:hypothetical protein
MGTRGANFANFIDRRAATATATATATAAGRPSRRPVRAEVASLANLVAVLRELPAGSFAPGDVVADRAIEYERARARRILEPIQRAFEPILEGDALSTADLAHYGSAWSVNAVGETLFSDFPRITLDTPIVGGSALGERSFGLAGAVLEDVHLAFVNRFTGRGWMDRTVDAGAVDGAMFTFCRNPITRRPRGVSGPRGRQLPRRGRG